VIHREVARLEQTVQAFLDFARLPSPQRSTCDMREIISQAIELVQARASQQGVEIDVDVPETAVPANVDRNQMCTVLVNLCLNALDAMLRGGRLQVALEHNRAGEISLTIVDTGPGILPEMVAKLFTPFASTKATGTGLGLSISQRIVEEHGGRINGANRPVGACFTIELPTGDDAGVDHARSQLAPPRALVHGHRT
jgi:signal transduction histidine kinase